MCYGRYRQYRREADEESRRIWADFERSTPVVDPGDDRDDEVPGPERTEASEEVATPDR
jgi:hypothetical protein